MTGTIGYAQPFRAIGQALETLNLQVFELEPTGEDFLIRGHLPNPVVDVSADGLSPASLNTVWGNLAPLSSENRPEQTEPTVPLLSPIELQYTNKDIDRLEQEGRANRTNPNRIPEYSSLSQILRCVGAYLVQKRARLIKLWRDSDSVSLEYQTSLGNMLKDTLVVGELYDLWVRMYMQRAERSTTL
ncbi:MAG TPA: hypothetical protein VN826_17490 [Candidatus Eisenbacteria bacterium]|jgi:hypothetical protein|nr:hypothetical protein [Candidatus Eisenbacteria bacterium]